MTIMSIKLQSNGNVEYSAVEQKGQCYWGSLGLLMSWEKAVFVARGFGFEGPQPPSRGEHLKEFVSGVWGVIYNLFCRLQGPGGLQVLEGK